MHLEFIFVSLKNFFLEKLFSTGARAAGLISTESAGRVLLQGLPLLPSSFRLVQAIYELIFRLKPPI